MCSLLVLDRPAYLGLDRDFAWRALIAEGMAQYGTHFAGSRLAAYCPSVYDELEATFCDWSGAPAALSLSSASLACALTVDMLVARGYTLVAGPLAHAAWRRPGVVEELNDAETWRARVARLLRAGRPVAVVTDRVCALRAREVDLTWVGELGVGRGQLLVVLDDSHTLGALRDGRGSYGLYRQRLPIEVDLLTLASLGKAFSTPGAMLAGAPWAVRAVRNSRGFGGASPLPPAYAHAVLNAFGQYGRSPLLAERQAALAEAIGLVERCGIVGAHVDAHPVFRLEEFDQQQRLTHAGIVPSRITYPQASSPAVVRLVLRADCPEAPERIAAALA